MQLSAKLERTRSSRGGQYVVILQKSPKTAFLTSSSRQPLRPNVPPPPPPPPHVTSTPRRTPLTYPYPPTYPHPPTYPPTTTYPLSLSLSLSLSLVRGYLTVERVSVGGGRGGVGVGSRGNLL